MNRKSAVFFAAISLLTLAIQPFFHKLGGLYAACPDMAAAFCAALPFAAGFWSVAYAAVMGFLTDMQWGSAFFSYTLFYTLTAFLCARAARTQKNAELSAAIAVAFCTAVRWFLQIVAAFARGYAVDFYAGLLKGMLPQALLSAAAAALWTMLLLKWSKLTPLRAREGGIKYR